MYNGGRSNCDTNPLFVPGKNTEFTRREADQKGAAKQTGWRRHGLPPLDAQIAKAEVRLQNQRHRNRNAVRALEKAAAVADSPLDCASSSLSSSSSSDSDSSGPDDIVVS